MVSFINCNTCHFTACVSVSRHKVKEGVPQSYCSILDWRIPWTEEPGGLQFTGPQRVGHYWATNAPILSLKLLQFCCSGRYCFGKDPLCSFYLLQVIKPFFSWSLLGCVFWLNNPQKEVNPVWGNGSSLIHKIIQRLREDIKLNVNRWVRSNL